MQREKWKQLLPRSVFIQPGWSNSRSNKWKKFPFFCSENCPPKPGIEGSHGSHFLFFRKQYNLSIGEDVKTFNMRVCKTFFEALSENSSVNYFQYWLKLPHPKTKVLFRYDSPDFFPGSVPNCRFFSPRMFPVFQSTVGFTTARMPFFAPKCATLEPSNAPETFYCCSKD